MNCFSPMSTSANLKEACEDTQLLQCVICVMEHCKKAELRTHHASRWCQPYTSHLPSISDYITIILLFGVF